MTHRTALSEHTKPEKVVQLLNKYFTQMTDIIFAHGGTLDKYIGDGLMALFGAPTATADDANNALHAAVAMQRSVKSINEELKAEGLKEIGIGIGLHTGEATVGYIGSERRSEYTAIGDTINIASRIEGQAKPGQILVTAATAQEPPRDEGDVVAGSDFRPAAHAGRGRLHDRATKRHPGRDDVEEAPQREAGGEGDSGDRKLHPAVYRPEAAGG